MYRARKPFHEGRFEHLVGSGPGISDFVYYDRLLCVSDFDRFFLSCMRCEYCRGFKERCLLHAVTRLRDAVLCGFVRVLIVCDVCLSVCLPCVVPFPAVLRAKGFYWTGTKPSDIQLFSLAGKNVRMEVSGVSAYAQLSARVWEEEMAVVPLCVSVRSSEC